MSNYEKLTGELLDKYRCIRKNALPEWAVHKITPGKTGDLVVPTIPFVGKQYADQENRILVYASAENLSNYCVGEYTDRAWLDNNEQAENRHRKCFDEDKQERKQVDAIPHVHCGPMDTGLLLTAVMYIADQLNIIDLSNNTPREFCEKISFGNYGKYTKESPHQMSKRKGISRQEAKKNIDYAGNIDLMEVSHNFVETDIKTLKPDYIILPGTMYNAAKKFIDSIKGSATIIPIQQMLAGNVNNHIAPNKNNKKRYRKYQTEEIHPAIQAVYRKMTDVSLDNYLYVFGYLDEVLNSLECNKNDK